MLQTNASLEELGIVFLHKVHLYSLQVTNCKHPEDLCSYCIGSLAVVWAVEKCKHFFYGKKFLVEIYQRPFKIMVIYSLTEAASMLQRLLMRILHYALDMKYTRGSTN